MTLVSRVSIDIRVQSGDWTSALEDIEPLSRRTIEVAAAEMDVAGEVSVLFTDDSEMRGLNRQWRGKDKATVAARRARVSRGHSDRSRNQPL